MAVSRLRDSSPKSGYFLGPFIRQQLAVDVFEPDATELTPALGSSVQERLT